VNDRVDTPHRCSGNNRGRHHVQNPTSDLGRSFANRGTGILAVPASCRASIPAKDPAKGPQGADMVTFSVNGTSRQLDVSADMPLLWAIRETLGLTGTKYGCGMALCGACTVHVDGAPARACVTPVSAVAGKQVTTIEGLSAKTDHPVQRAWMELDVPQCGYCQSGQLMSAAALLAQNKTPSDQDIDQAMAGNICRCGTYQRIRAAIHRAAALARGGA
jgi:isoquinoline 1-oxidoreductase alpha subunit